MKNRIKSLFALLLLVPFAAFAQFPTPVEPNWKDVNYAGDDLKAHNLDIYLPKTQQEAYKVIVAIYGSAWFANDAKPFAFMSLGQPLIDAGFAVVCINHRIMAHPWLWKAFRGLTIEPGPANASSATASSSGTSVPIRASQAAWPSA